MQIQALPSLVLTSKDEERLGALLHHGYRGDLRGCSPAVLDFLSKELARADVVDPRRVPPDVVTMNSRVLYSDDQRGIRREVTLVYPGAEKNGQGKISVLSSLGSALIGLSEGQSLSWLLPDEPWRTVSVHAVTYQPEANGRFAV